MWPSELRVDAVGLNPTLKCICALEILYFVHSTIVALCAACHACRPSGKATHLHRERQQRACAFVQMYQTNGVRVSMLAVRNYELNGDCICFSEDCFHAWFEDIDRKAEFSRRCYTCNQRMMTGGTRWKRKTGTA